MEAKPFSESCERNKEPILAVIAPYLSDARSLLEIGSGTGQHAVYFGAQFNQLVWHTSDRVENHGAINCWLEEAQLKNVKAPLPLDVLTDDWPDTKFDAVFSANTAHIMPWAAVEAMIAGVGRILNTDGVFLLYGPFNYNGEFTSESNVRFEMWLKSQAAHQGIRDFEAMEKLAGVAGMQLINDVAMPANNRILVWQKST